jgi:hypothetical protein
MNLKRTIKNGQLILFTTVPLYSASATAEDPDLLFVFD